MCIRDRNRLFHDFYTEEIKYFLLEYLDDHFVDPGRIITRPKVTGRAIYFILMGQIRQVKDGPNSMDYIRRFRSEARSAKENDRDIDYGTIETECLEDELDDANKNNQIDDIEPTSDILSAGQSFGALPFHSTAVATGCFYIAHSACYLGVFTQKAFELMRISHPEMYEKLRTSLLNDIREVDESEEYSVR
eukprot:TRINITY_DN2579_c0_g1_i3.p1 TRINITY_DN2579_c0_g1~~TRINITY_DN2579_c0_g1_i3.p1  ORF type:complete len:191 (-),score=22.80 TRINITY_DN2579_c0_g1_i3:94-666(-)